MIVTAAAKGAPPRAVIMDFGLARALDRAVASEEEGHSVRAGTVDYMAPELRTGGKATIRSDIFALGTVARQLLPNDRLWDQLTSPLAEERPESLDWVRGRLDPRSSRRYWIGGLAVAAAGLAIDRLRPSNRNTAGLPAGARILVNGFRVVGGQVLGARLARSVLLTSLQQSPRLQPIADQDLFPVLKRMDPGGSLPLAGQALTTLLTQLRAAFWIDGNLQQAGGR